MKACYFSLIALFLISWSTLIGANTHVSFDGILGVWRDGGNRELVIDNCNAYTGEQGDMKIVIVNERCNLLHFSMYVF